MKIQDVGPSFQTTKKDVTLISQIVNRACQIAALQGVKLDALELDMDITACHANGCPLKLVELLKADEFNFMHDAMGIRRHINRANGKLMNCFLPRYARGAQNENQD